jgi:C-terminal processing protease CtpA/Prc
MFTQFRNVFSQNNLKLLISGLLILFSVCLQSAKAQITLDIGEKRRVSDPSRNRERGLKMLKEIKAAVKERYYDPKFHGINLDERFKAASDKIKTLNSNWEISLEIAQVLLEFNDSHTRFYPPQRADNVEYGFSIQMIGSNCHIVNIKKGSNAEAKQLHPGDKILKIGTYQPTRENLWMLNYYLYNLDPQPALPLTVENLKGEQRTLEVQAKIISLEERNKQKEKRKTEQKETPYKCAFINANTITCKLYSFSVEKEVINKMMKEVGSHQNLILDLRGNHGGYVKTEMYLTGYFFDHDVKIGDEKTREGVKERIAKSLKDKAYKGNLAVLIDSESASAAEVFARVIQIEKRGKIVGDQSSGAVMTSNFLQMQDVRQSGLSDAYTLYAINLTVGDLIMSDGNRLEGFGVVPDAPVGPSGFAISQKSDPVLAYAAALFNSKISPEDAGKFKFLAEKNEEDETESDSSEGEN